MSSPATTSTAEVTTGEAGVEGNSRLTAVNGMILLALLAAEGVTVLGVQGMITPHIYLGLLLVGPVLLKCATTGYRFVRYYTGTRSYIRKGPPHPILRVLGPVVVASSLAVLGTGIGLIYTGPAHREPLLTLHKSSFIIWFAVTSIHVLGHLLDAATATWRELRDPRVSPAARGRRWRTIAVTISLVVGVGLATAVLPSTSAWTSHLYDRIEHSGGDH